MNSSWPLVPLNKLCDRITVGHVGPMVNEYVDEGIPFLRSQNILPFRIETNNMKFISPSFHEKLRKSALRPGDVAVVRTGYPGTAAVVPHSLGDANCADLVVITPGPGLDAFFLAAIFNSNWGIASVGGRLVGSAQQHFNIGAARRMELHLPPIAVQRKIAAILSAYDELVENNARRFKLLEEMAQRIYREWFVDFRYPGHENVPLVDSELGPVPQGWSIGRVRDHADVIRGRSYRGGDVVDDGGVPFINLKCVARDGGFRHDGIKRYVGEFKDVHKVRAGDIVMAVTDMTQERRIVARSARIPDVGEEFGVFSMDLVKIVPRDVPSEYLLGMLRYTAFPDQVKAHANGANVLHLHPDRISEYHSVFPSPEVARHYADVVAPTQRLQDVLQSATGRLRATRDLLLARLVSGDVDVTDLDIAVPETAA